MTHCITENDIGDTGKKIPAERKLLVSVLFKCVFPCEAHRVGL